MLHRLVSLLYLTTLLVKGHGTHEEESGMDGMNGEAFNADESRRKQELFLVLHAFIASVIVWITLPISIALVSGRKLELHKQVSTVNTLGIMFLGLVAVLGFAEGESWHAIIALITLGAWVAQASYGWLRNFAFRGMPLKPHRFLGLALFVMTFISWVSGVLHVLGSCNALSDVQMCNAHFYLGALFVIVGLVDGYYQPDFAAKVEMFLAVFGGISELVGEGLVDSILNSIDPDTFYWDSMAKTVHLATASLWIISGFVGWIVAVKWPSTLSRGITLVVGSTFHLIFMFMHGQDASTLTKTAHLVHEIALVPVLFTRFSGKIPKLTSYMLIVSGFAFCFAADPVTRDLSHISPIVYVLIILSSATLFHIIHGFIRLKILRKSPSDTMFERTGCADIIYYLIDGVSYRLCRCCPALPIGSSTSGSTGAKYDQLETTPIVAVDEEAKVELDEDVTSAPQKM